MIIIVCFGQSTHFEGCLCSENAASFHTLYMDGSCKIYDDPSPCLPPPPLSTHIGECTKWGIKVLSAGIKDNRDEWCAV